MEKTIKTLNEIKLVGISTRTSNEKEMNAETAQISNMMTKFFSPSTQSKILEPKNPGTVFAVYTKYESDEHGEYTYFLGKEVNDFKNIENDLETLVIPEQTYVKFTSTPGPMPSVCIDMWKKIWKMNKDELQGKRAYIADFEIYDERSYDNNNAVLDIYIGIEDEQLKNF